MAKFSVRKPLTVFVAAIAVIILGFVAYTRMTPDLLPNMDFPYVIIMTTYPGASPDTVETEITRPLEQSMATLENIKSVTSTSSENYSMVTLEFEEGTNLDTANVDIQQAISQLQGSWDSSVGTPYVLKINPSILPVSMVAVSYEGKDVIELSDFINETLMNELEGTAGVARISTMGSVTREVHIVIDGDKVDRINDDITAAINEQLDDAEGQLRNAQAQLADAQQQLAAGQDALVNGTASGSAEINSNQMQMLQTIIQLRDQIVTLNQNKTQIQTTLATLSQVKAQVDEINTQKATLQAQLEALTSLKAQAEAADAALAAATPGTPEYDAASAQVDAVNAALEAAGFTGAAARVQLDASIGMVNDGIAQLDSGLASIDQSLQSQGLSLAELDSTIAGLNSGISEIYSAIGTLNSTIEQLEAGTISLSDGVSALTEAQTSGILQMASGYTQIAVNQSTITSALAQVESGRDSATGAADMSSQLNISTVSQILAAQHFSMPAGYVEEDGINYMVSVGDEFENVDEIEDLLLFDTGVDGVGEVYLSDVADIFITDNSAETYAKLNGEDGVILSFEKQSTAATASVSDGLTERFAELEEEYPGLHFVSLMDQGEYIHIIISSIVQSLLFGAVFAIIVLILFLRDVRPTIITVVSIPVSVIFALALMYFTGISLNMISLSGLAVSVGMLVDNSIVVIENVYRLRSKGATAVQAAVTGTRQVTGAVIASTLTTVCVFLPIVFVQGTTRQLFTDLALTMGFSLVASLIVSLTVVPAMASLMLKGGRYDRKTGPKKESVIYKKYTSLLRWCLNHKKIVLPLALVLLVLSSYLAVARGYSFMPEMDMNQAQLSITMPEECTREEAVNLANDVLQRIEDANIDGIVDIGAMMGASMSMSSGGSYDVSIYIQLEEGESGIEVGREIEELCSDMDCTVDAQSSSMSMSTLTGSGVSVRLLGDDAEAMHDAAVMVAGAMEDVEGIDEIDDGLEDETGAIHVTVNKQEAMSHGYTTAQVFMQIASELTTSSTAITMPVEGTTSDVIVENSGAVTVDDLRAIEFTYTNADGEEDTVRLDQIATVEETVGMSSIKRIDQRRYLDVTATSDGSTSVTILKNRIEEAVAELQLPEGVTYEFSGENETVMKAVYQLFEMIGLGILLVYFIMVAQFQSLKSPFIVMFTIPLAFTGGFLALLICGMDVSVISLIGFVMLTGIIVNNGIVLVDYVNQLRAGGIERREALVRAGVTRLRPIFMTTFTTVLGLIVMALGLDAGTAMMQPMAVVCIGGLLYATLMTLIVIPCIYDIMNKKPVRVVTEEDMYFDDIHEVEDELHEMNEDDSTEG